MPSQAIQRFHDACRPRLRAVHAEDVVVHRPGQPEITLSVVWRRVQAATIPAPSDGIGLLGYSGQAIAVASKVDIGKLPHGTVIVRASEEWVLRHQESADAWTWNIHLAEPDRDLRVVRGRS